MTRRLLTPWILLLAVAFCGFAEPALSRPPLEPRETLTLKEALDILNDSPWSRQQTFTRVIEGVGSGLFGEKEVFSRYYLRILSARPVQEAYERVRESLKDREGLDEDRFREYMARLDSDRFIVVALTFRSNDPDREREVMNALRTLATETLRNRAYLSTTRYPQLQLASYQGPTDPAIGATFFFPRDFQGHPVIHPEDDTFVVDLELPGQPKLRVTFPVNEEVSSSGERAIAPAVPENIAEFAVVNGRPIDGGESRRLGGVVNVFPQSSARAVRGSVYWFHRNDNLDARNFFDELGEPLPEFKRNQFGVNLGAQVGSHLDLFGSFDALRVVRGSTELSLIPSTAMRGGDFSELLRLEEPVQLLDPFTGLPFANNQIPDASIHPVARRLLPFLPDPNRDDAVRNFVTNQPLVRDADEITLRGDYTFDEQSSMTVSYRLRDGNDLEVHPLPTFGSQSIETNQELSVSYRRSFGANTTASWRAEFERDAQLRTTRFARESGLVSSLGIEGLQIGGPEDEGFPAFELSGFQGFGDEDLPQNEVDNEFEYSGNATFARGNHSFRVWGRLEFDQRNDSRSSSLERGEFSFTGRFTGDAFADFLLGRAEEATRAVGSSRQDLRRWSTRVGFSDQWRIDPRLTLSLGVVHHYFSPYRSLRSNISFFRPLSIDPPPDGELLAPNGGASGTVVNADKNNFSPRVGLAFRPMETSRLVIRSSYDIFYQPLPTWVFENFMGRNFPFYTIRTSQASNDSSGLDLSAPFNSDIPAELTVRDIEPDLPTSYWQSFNLRVESELTDSWSMAAAFNGGRGVHQRRVLFGNVPLPGPGPLQPRRPNPDFGEFLIINAGGSTTRHELDLSLAHRFSEGFSLDTSFKLLRLLDDDYGGQPSNPRNLSAERGPRRGSRLSELRLSFIAELPFGKGRALGGNSIIDGLLGGLRLSGIVRASSGRPFTITLPGDANNDGLSNDRPDRIASGELDSSQRSIDRWFDTSAFAFPSDPFGFGNAGRNILTGPGYHNWDLSLIKEVGLSNGHRLELRFAFFNAFNKANFSNPDSTLGTRSFGTISSAARAREIEIALKYSF